MLFDLETIIHQSFDRIIHSLIFSHVSPITAIYSRILLALHAVSTLKKTRSDPEQRIYIIVQDIKHGSATMLNINTPLRIVQTGLAIVALGLNGYGEKTPSAHRPRLRIWLTSLIL